MPFIISSKSFFTFSPLLAETSKKSVFNLEDFSFPSNNETTLFKFKKQINNEKNA